MFYIYHVCFDKHVVTAKILFPQKWRRWRQGTLWLDNANDLEQRFPTFFFSRTPKQKKDN